jgi:hypothetical protein
MRRRGGRTGSREEDPGGGGGEGGSTMSSFTNAMFNPENSCIFQCRRCKRSFAMSLAKFAEAHEGIEEKHWDTEVRIQCTRCKRFLSKNQSPLIAVIGYGGDPDERYHSLMQEAKE